MTTNICRNCLEKIDEFIRFRETCAAKNIELRMTFGLPIENDETSADNDFGGAFAEPELTNELTSFAW